MQEAQKNIIEKLRREILLAEGYKPASAEARSVTGLQSLERAFPNGILPTGTIHEFLTPAPETVAASSGFIGGLLAALMPQGGVCLWISTARMIFPTALKAFGLDPHRVIFVDLRRDKDVLWAMDEALKCEGITAVVAELRELTFMQSQRLQLAVESSRVTGFVLRTDLRRLSTTACAARWQITPIPSLPEPGLPGVGFPCWQVDLLKVRNGRTGSWKIAWRANSFVQVSEPAITIEKLRVIRKVG